MDYFLQPGMKSLPSFLQDTKHTLEIIEDINKKVDSGELSLEGVAVVSLDVESMYTNMTKDLGKTASKEALDDRNVVGCADNDVKVKTESIMKALEHCIENNFFKFDSTIYQQTGGVGTGVKLAPPFACLGMGKYEDLVFSSDQELLKLILIWRRFIDDVFMLFKGSEEQCRHLVEWLKSLMPGVVKFKYHYSEEKMPQLRTYR